MLDRQLVEIIDTVSAEALNPHELRHAFITLGLDAGPRSATSSAPPPTPTPAPPPTTTGA